MDTIRRHVSLLLATAALGICAATACCQDASPPRAYLGPPIEVTPDGSPAGSLRFSDPRPTPVPQTSNLTPKTSPDRFELPRVPPGQPGERPLPINLPTALQLAGASPLDIALASQRLRAAHAELSRANVLWLPTIYMGVDYFRHDGNLQDVVGNVFNANKSSFMVGATPNVVFAVTDAIYAPLSARQVVRAREADLQASHNDSLLAVAEAYFNVQQARGEVAGAVDSLRRTEMMVKRIENLVEALSPRVEKNRVLTELASRQQAVEMAYERWQTAGAELSRLLRLDPTALVQPIEPPHLNVSVINLRQDVSDLITVGLTKRPELASQQALVQATLARLRQEKIRPFVPSVVIRGAATNPAGTLSSGYFGGGTDGSLSNFGLRNTMDVQLLWEFQNLGFGNQALVRQREAERQQAILSMYRTQDVIAAEIVRAHAQATRAENRLRQSEEGLKNALITVETNLEGLQNTRNIGGVLVLVFRPFEVVAAIQTLDQAYRNYYGAIADSNRAQFRLYRAIGQPAQSLMQ